MQYRCTYQPDNARNEHTMSNLFNTISQTMNTMSDEVARIADENEAPSPRFTGKIHLDTSSKRVWFELLDDEYNVLSWITPDAPELAAPGETLCAAASLEEALMLGSDD